MPTMYEHRTTGERVWIKNYLPDGSLELSNGKNISSAAFYRDYVSL